MDHPPRSQEERTCEQHFLDNTIRHMSGRFIVQLPVKKSFTVLGTSHKVAETRFLILEKRLSRITPFDKSVKIT